MKREPTSFSLLDERPKTRGECIDGERPCPFVSCRHHLYLSTTDAGSIRVEMPGTQPEDLAMSCSLDVADEGGITLEEIAALMNLSRERVRQIEVSALHKVRAKVPEGAQEWSSLDDGDRDV